MILTLFNAYIFSNRCSMYCIEHPQHMYMTDILIKLFNSYLNKNKTHTDNPFLLFPQEKRFIVIV